MRTPIVNDKDIKRVWKLVDATDQTVGRLASKIAVILTGKDKPAFSPHQDWGDNVVVINAEKVRLTGNKEEQKTYFSHSLYPGGETLTPYKEMMEKKPTEIVRKAVKGMIKSKSTLGRNVFKKLHVYAGSDHPHVAQQPVLITL